MRMREHASASDIHKRPGSEYFFNAGTLPQPEEFLPLYPPPIAIPVISRLVSVR